MFSGHGEPRISARESCRFYKKQRRKELLSTAVRVN